MNRSIKQVRTKFKCLACSMRFNRRDKGRCPRCWSKKIRDDREEFKLLNKRKEEEE
jgi:Zn finger protein HypA/HybF involved in hydrogenase expression